MKTTAKTFKKALALLLCLATCAAMLVPVASAETPAGTPITTEAELKAMTSNNTYYLANDIVLTEKWTPLATKTSFVLDGNGKTISNFVIDDTSIGSFTNVGLISEFDSNSQIKNLTIEGSITIKSKTGGLCLGSFVGKCTGGDITNCVSYVNIEIDAPAESTANNYCGGIVGLTHTASNVSDCKNYGDISNTNAAARTQYAAGIVGTVNYGLEVENCDNYGTIHAASGENGFAGGIVGRLTYKSGHAQSIVNCRNFGAISADYYAAGVVAQDSCWGVDVIGCENYGDITSEVAASGIHGWVRQENETNTYREGSALYISRCVNFGKITTTGDYGQYATGIVTGSHNGAKNIIVKVEYCANLGDIYASSTGDAQSGGIFGRAGQMNVNSSISYCYNAGSTVSTKGQWIAGICGSDGSLKYNYNFTTTDKLFQHNASGNKQYKTGNEIITAETDLAAVVATLNTGLETPAFRLNKGAIEPIYSLNKNAVLNVGVQETKAQNGTFSVRFVSYVNSLSYTAAGFKVSAVIVKNGETTNVAEKTYAVTTAYDSLTASTENGMEKLTSPMGTDYLALTMNNVPADATVTFTFTPYVVSGETTINGNAITVTYVNGVIA